MQPVGQKKPNAWGLFDMHGNALEWCNDRYDSVYYAKSLTDDPTGPSEGLTRVQRGGAKAKYCHSAYRAWYAPALGSSDLGFRVALVPAE